ncbi:hypothetical protein X769_15690 [Mesorhizobium sp. LSJC268A00]|nr:hypothetical protein X769_15690 [Mesorhizobium sp. LSJC268A00]ESZ10777.1 hypothetical protein X735_27610 [Mesorhizobium sp. L2C085B000]
MSYVENSLGMSNSVKIVFYTNERFNDSGRPLSPQSLAKEFAGSWRPGSAMSSEAITASSKEHLGNAVELSR